MSNGLNGFIERSHFLEKREDERVIEKSEPVDEGGVKEVYPGIRNDFLIEEEKDPAMRQMFWDLRESDRVVNTWIYTEDGVDLIKKDEVPFSFHEVVKSEGLEYAVREAVEVFEDFANHGYVYCDLTPENIRFDRVGKAVAIDYLDKEATEPLEEVNETYAAAMSYDLFARDLESSIPGLKALEVERVIDRYSNHVETEEYTGEPLMDFAGLELLMG